MVTPSSDVTEEIASRFRDHRVEGDAFLGYRILASPGSPDAPLFFVLNDATGAILCRSRDVAVVLDTLTSHLHALALGPPEPTHARVALRALFGQGTGVLVLPPVLSSPPPIERRLARLGFRVADTPFVDVDVATGALRPFDPPGPMVELRSTPGHVPVDQLEGTIGHLFWPAGPGSTPPSVAERCAALANTILGEPPEDCVRKAQSMAERLQLFLVEPDRDAAAYEALAHVRG